MPDEIVTVYELTFADGTRRELAVRLRPAELELVPEQLDEEPEWIRLGFQQCPNCSLNEADHRHCPVARNLVPVNDVFCHRVSCDEVDVVVYANERSYRKICSLQEAVSSLMGLVMATSGCPHLDKLRPMVYTHLPFSTADQATYRAVSMYLLAQFFRRRRGLTPDWELKDLARTYEHIRTVNQAFARRLVGIQREDANLNAIVSLDMQAGLASLSITDEEWDQLEPIFRPYLGDTGDGAPSQAAACEAASVSC